MLFQSLKSRLLLFVLSIISLTVTTLIFLVQDETEKSIMAAQLENAENVLDMSLLAVENQYQSIIFNKNSILERRKDELKNIIQLQLAELDTFYRLFEEGLVTEEEAKNRAIARIKRLRYDDGIGYIWINDMTWPIPTMIMHPTIPDLDGTILDDPGFDTALGRNENLFTAFVAVCLESGEGYVDYLWPKPTEQGLTSFQPKISYVSAYEPWGWILGTGVYIDDIEEEADRRLQAVIDELEITMNQVKVAETGYIFIFNGDNKIILHPTLDQGSDVSDLINPATGNPIFADLRESSGKPDKMLRYLWNTPERRDEYIFWKIAFTEHFEPLDWYIGSSVYEEEIEAPAEALTLKIIYFSIILLIIVLFMSVILSQSLIKPVKMLSLSVKGVDEKGVDNVTVPIVGTVETKNLGNIINRTFQSLRESKIKLENYQEHLKEEVNLRTREVEESNRQLKSAKEAAEASNRAKSTFLANMSHEIRTPMNAILGFTEILADEENNPEKKHYISNIQSSGKALLSLINDILDLSKVEAGKMNLQYNPVPISAIFDEMDILFDSKIREKGLELIIARCPDDDEEFLLDSTRLRQVLINLIGNAVKFTTEGTIRIIPEISLSSGAQSEMAEINISVIDTGIGIAEDQLEHIFNPFEQQDGQKMSSHEGTGLGLAITRRLVQLMGGTIEVTSEPGAGSCFKIILKDAERAPMTEEKAVIESLPPDNIVFDRKCLLIVDDIDYNRELLIKYLSRYEFEYIEASNGSQAVILAGRHKPDLILMDMKMPVMNGYEACELIRSDPELKEIPIIAITASAMKSDRERIQGLCSSYLRKPVKKSELIQELMEYLPWHKDQIETPLRNDVSDDRIIWPPEELLLPMGNCALIGDIEGVGREIEKLREKDASYDPICDYFTDLTKKYRLQEIAAAIEKRKGDENE